MSYKVEADYYVEATDSEIVLMLEFDYQRAERATYWEPGCGASLTLCNVTMKDGSPMGEDLDVWAQNYLDENTRFIVDHTVNRGRDY